MSIETLDFITRTVVKNNPDKLFVFGDNMQRRGFGGQAREMRGESNTVGIPTKRAPGREPHDFFADEHYQIYVDATRPAFRRLAHHLRNRQTVILPKAGLGTERAQLKERSPLIWNKLQDDLAVLYKIAEREM